jgi:hypothetical protein
MFYFIRSFLCPTFGFISSFKDHENLLFCVGLFGWDNGFGLHHWMEPWINGFFWTPFSHNLKIYGGKYRSIFNRKNSLEIPLKIIGKFQ